MEMIPQYCATSIHEQMDLQLPLNEKRLERSFGRGARIQVFYRGQAIGEYTAGSRGRLSAPCRLDEGINPLEIQYRCGGTAVTEEAEIFYLPRPSAVVDKNDPFAFSTVAEAIAYASRQEKPSVYIAGGTYYEKLKVTVPGMVICGESTESVLITYDDFSAKVVDEATGAQMGTFATPTFTIAEAAAGTKMYNLTLNNTYDRYKRPGFETREERIAQGTYDIDDGLGCQAVALRVDADRCTFRNLHLNSGQDTLFDNINRHYFYHCRIAGDVDFIFGEAQSVYEDCDIISRDIYSLPKGYIVAPKTGIEFEFGYLFLDCRFLHTIKKPLDTVYLARPWRQDGCVFFKNCYMDEHIKAQGYTDMPSGPFYSFAEKARFYEFGSYGAGALTSPTRKIASEELAARCTKAAVLSGNNGKYSGAWMPE